MSRVTRAVLTLRWAQWRPTSASSLIRAPPLLLPLLAASLARMQMAAVNPCSSEAAHSELGR